MVYNLVYIFTLICIQISIMKMSTCDTYCVLWFLYLLLFFIINKLRKMRNFHLVILSSIFCSFPHISGFLLLLCLWPDPQNEKSYQLCWYFESSVLLQKMHVHIYEQHCVNGVLSLTEKKPVKMIQSMVTSLAWKNHISINLTINHVFGAPSQYLTQF